MPFPAKQVVAWTMCVLMAVMPPAAAQQPAPEAPKPVPLPKALPPGFGARVQPQQPQAAEQTAPEPAKPAAPKQETPAGPVTAPAATYGGLNLQNVSLVEVIDYLARELKINYVIDPSVKGSVTLNTYGEARDIDPRQLLDTILRINGYAMVQTGRSTGLCSCRN
jgi:pyruvate/2-oxoglutarate dehydrogenase complex dihydrolipoamide acyltransferase (E2) component